MQNDYKMVSLMGYLMKRVTIKMIMIFQVKPPNKQTYKRKIICDLRIKKCELWCLLSCSRRKQKMSLMTYLFH